MKEPEKMTPIELREAVAREVMGETQRAVRVKGGTETVLTWSPNKFFSDGTCTREEIENYAPCTPYDLEISAAFQVVEKLLEKVTVQITGGESGYAVEFSPYAGDGWGVVQDESLARAICRAALKAVRSAK